MKKKFRHGRRKSKRIAKYLKAINAGQVYGYRYTVKMFAAIKTGAY